MKFKELWHISPTESAICEREYPRIEKEQLLIRSHYSLISTGTEKLVSSGKTPPEMYTAMSVPYMNGYLGLPVKYGYSLVGKVIEGPEPFLDQTVHLMHPHQDYAQVNAKDVTIVPPEIPLPRATLASNMETAVNALWDCEISIGDSVLICGFGIIGSLISILARQIPGVDVSILEVNPDRIEAGRYMDFNLFTEVPEKKFDVAINTTGSEDALQLCIDHTTQGGIVAELSWYGDHKVSLRLGSNFHIGQKRIISSQASHIPLNKQHKFNIPKRKDIVFTLLKNNIFDKLPLHTIPFDKLPDTFRQMRNQTYHHFCTIVKY
jgi:threonine dehydrogenase-like Zn-dependent dehydrogenase